MPSFQLCKRGVFSAFHSVLRGAAAALRQSGPLCESADDIIDTVNGVNRDRVGGVRGSDSERKGAQLARGAGEGPH